MVDFETLSKMKKILLIILMTVSFDCLCPVFAGPRKDVIQIGNNAPPRLTQKSAKKSGKCPPDWMPFNNFTLCCASIYRLHRSGCPNDQPFLRFGDPAKCCSLNNTAACDYPGNKCSWKRSAYSCPSTYPFALDHGSKCCRNMMRGQNCPLGSNSTLQRKDPIECCSGGLITPCLTPSGIVGFCNSYYLIDNLICPSTYPFAVNGISCCQNQARDISCPVGVHSPVQSTDPEACCLANMTTDCMSPSGAPGVCQSFSCNIAGPTIYSSDSLADAVRDTENVLTNDCEGSSVAGSQFWAAQDGAVNMGFIIDIGCPRTLKSITLRNTHNNYWNDRGTNGFRIDVSQNLTSWVTVVTGNLANVWGIYCTNPSANPIPLQVFQTSSMQPATKYLRFWVTSYYGAGPGVEYISWTTY